MGGVVAVKVSFLVVRYNRRHRTVTLFERARDIPARKLVCSNGFDSSFSFLTRVTERTCERVLVTTR